MAPNYIVTSFETFNKRRQQPLKEKTNITGPHQQQRQKQCVRDQRIQRYINNSPGRDAGKGLQLHLSRKRSILEPVSAKHEQPSIKLQNIGGSNGIGFTTKIIHIYSIVKPKLRYGATTWRTTATIIKKIQEDPQDPLARQERKRIIIYKKTAARLRRPPTETLASERPHLSQACNSKRQSLTWNPQVKRNRDVEAAEESRQEPRRLNEADWPPMPQT
ncbi:hypothetical protein DPMN_053739 [Dreissena polymorpha]|uniref:Uncharacterized protein n=1 Tax=Dreissena polymorpha TaxID=45954 RepID=A0A9D4HQJ7_DREPO|nr:hypothetical protein DPMN_053739 [Dreissena polymorpha]